MALQHYVNQPKSTLCRKHERNYIAEEDPVLMSIIFSHIALNI